MSGAASRAVCAARGAAEQRTNPGLQFVLPQGAGDGFGVLAPFLGEFALIVLFVGVGGFGFCVPEDEDGFSLLWLSLCVRFGGRKEGL